VTTEDLSYLNDPDFHELQRIVYRECQLAYAKLVCPWAVLEEIHVCFASIAERIARGELDRVMIEMPPRGMKSYWWSVITPSWWVGKFPTDKVMEVSYKVDLTADFSRDIKNIVRSPEYRFVFPGVSLAKDSHAVGRWRIEEITKELGKIRRTRDSGKQGQFHGAGVLSGIAGTGFNLGIVDDALNEQDMDSKIAKDRVWNWWGPGFYTRRQPEKNAIVVIGTRWATDDLVGRLRELGDHGGDEWEIFSIPAILNGDQAKKIYTTAKEYGSVPGVFDKPIELKAGDSFSPRRFSVKELMRSKANMTSRAWNALYMQNPQEDEGHILKRHWWRLWPKKEAPECVFVFQMYDTALEAKQTNDYSARTTWGVFEHKSDDGDSSFNMILLDRWKAQVETPVLRHQVLIGHFGGKEAKRIIMEKYPGDKALVDKIDEKAIGFRPDRILIEAKAGAQYLIQEFRRMRNPSVPVWPWKGVRGTQGELGKYARAMLAQLVLEQGAVWYMDVPWSEEVINECARCKFDGSDAFDDLPDTVVNAMLYVRQRYYVQLPSDVDEDEEALKSTRKESRQFYGSRA
jgi:hypothetical protein